MKRSLITNCQLVSLDILTTAPALTRHPPLCKLSAVVFSQVDNSPGGRPAVGNESHLKYMVMVLSQYFFNTLSPKHGQRCSQGVSHSSLMMMMMNWRIMRLIVQMFLQVEREDTLLSSKQTPPTPPPPSFLQHLDLQVSSYLSGWSISWLNGRRSQLAESKWDSFNGESFKSRSVVVTQKSPKTR